MKLKYYILIIMILLFYACGIISKKEISNKKYSLEEAKVINNDFLLVLDTVIEKSKKCIFAQEINPYFFVINFSPEDTISINIFSVQYGSTLTSEIYFMKRFSKYCFYYRGILFVAPSSLSEVNIFETCGREIDIYPYLKYKDYRIVDYYNRSIRIWFQYYYINERFILVKEELCDENIRDRKMEETKDKIIYRR